MNLLFQEEIIPEIHAFLWSKPSYDNSDNLLDKLHVLNLDQYSQQCLLNNGLTVVSC